MLQKPRAISVMFFTHLKAYKAPKEASRCPAWRFKPCIEPQKFQALGSRCHNRPQASRSLASASSCILYHSSITLCYSTFAILCELTPPDAFQAGLDVATKSRSRHKKL